jgi:hypothetical protein
MDPNQASCAPWAHCGGTNKCEVCGGSGEPCCPSNVAPYCHGGLACGGGNMCGA